MNTAHMEAEQCTCMFIMMPGKLHHSMLPKKFKKQRWGAVRPPLLIPKVFFKNLNRAFNGSHAAENFDMNIMIVASIEAEQSLFMCKTFLTIF